MKQKVILDIEKYKIITILRGLTKEEILKTVDAMVKGGIKLVEVTFDKTGKIPDETTAENINAIATNFKGVVRVGAGTLMTERQVELAKNAGAIVRREFNQGKGNVVRSMFRDIEADCYIMVDADNTYPADAGPEIEELVLSGKADMVIGDRLSSTYLIKGLLHNLKRGFSQGTSSLVPIPPAIKIA